MAHVTTGFNSQRWKNHIPKSWAAEVGVEEGSGMAVKEACMCCIGDGQEREVVFYRA